MVRPNVLAVVSIAWLGLSAASSLQGAENVLSRIPEGACGAAVLNRLFQTDAKIQGLANQVRIERASPLSSLKGWLGVQQGLDEQGSALLVLMPVGDRKTPPAAIFFLPVTDYQQFLRALSPQDAARITTVKLGKEAALVGTRDGYAVFAEPKHREILEKVLTSGQGCAAIAPLHAFLTDNDVAAVVLGNVAESWSRSLAATIEHSLKGSAFLREQQDDASVEFRVTNLSTPLLAVLELYGSVLREAGEEIDSFAAGCRITAQGEIRVSQQLRFKPGGGAAKFINQVKAPEGNLVSGLPPGPYAFAAAGVVPERLRQCRVPSSLQAATVAPKSSGLNAEQVRKLGDISLRAMQGVRRVAVMVNLGKPEELLYGNLLSVTKVDDAQTYMRNYEEALQAIQEVVKRTEKSPWPTLEFKRAQFDWAFGLEISVQYLRLPGPEGIPGYNQLTENLADRGKKTVVYVAPADEHTIVVAYMSQELLQQSIAAAKTSKNLSSDQQLAQTAAMFSPGAEWIAFWRPDLRFWLPEWPPTPPIGFAARSIPNGLQAELIVPAPVIQAIGRTPLLELYHWYLFALVPFVWESGLVRPTVGQESARPKEVQHHVYELKKAPKMLTEELALEKARETFAKEGYKLDQWHVYRPDYPPRHAPDGTPDKYFDRFSFRPTEGRVHFTDGKQYRIVGVRLEGDRLVCFMFYGL